MAGSRVFHSIARCLAALGERPGTPSKFKIGNLQDIPEGEPILYYQNGDFLDLCAGPHVMRTGNIGVFKLTTVASAYCKGDEKNPQLQRIYGTAFKNKTALDDTMLVIGGRDVEAGQVSVRLHTGGPLGAKPKAEVVANLLAAIKERRA